MKKIRKMIKTIRRDSHESNRMQKIYNAENIIEAEMLVEMLKENGIAAFTQEPSSSVAAYGVAGFGVYGVDIWAEADEAEKAVQIIEEIEKSLDTENAE